MGNFNEFDYRHAGCVDSLTFEYGYLHDTSNTPIQGDGTFGLGCSPGGVTVQHTVISRNTSNSAHHSEGWAENDMNCDSSCTNTSQSINPNPFTGAQASIPTFVWDQINSGTNASIARAWSGALTLILLVMALNLVARLIARYNRVT